jgi:hypothetical protein
MHSTANTEQAMTISWAENENAAASSVDELDEQLDALDARAREGEPFVAELVHPNGAVLSIGLGRDRSVLNHSASPDPPYYTSHDPESDEDGVVVFYFYGHWSEYSADAAVPMDEAREAARRFFRTGQRPESVDWRMD